MRLQGRWAADEHDLRTAPHRRFDALLRHVQAVAVSDVLAEPRGVLHQVEEEEAQAFSVPRKLGQIRRALHAKAYPSLLALRCPPFLPPHRT